MRPALCVDVHSLADLAVSYFAQITSVAFAARMTARELDRDGHQALLSAIESLALAAQREIEDQCALSDAFDAQQMDEEGAK